MNKEANITLSRRELLQLFGLASSTSLLVGCGVRSTHLDTTVLQPTPSVKDKEALSPELLFHLSQFGEIMKDNTNPIISDEISKGLRTLFMSKNESEIKEHFQYESTSLGDFINTSYQFSFPQKNHIVGNQLDDQSNIAVDIYQDNRPKIDQRDTPKTVVRIFLLPDHNGKPTFSTGREKTAVPYPDTFVPLTEDEMKRRIELIANLQKHTVEFSTGISGKTRIPTMVSAQAFERPSDHPSYEVRLENYGGAEINVVTKWK